MLVLVSTILVLAMPATEVADLAGSTWKFKKVTSEDPSTTHYLNVMYGDAEYQFADDHTYKGTFCGLSLSGTWEVSNNTLFLNKGTYKEETYALTSLSRNNFILQATEKGKQASLEFVKQ